MRHGKLILITVVVLTAGAVAALPYHRDPPPADAMAANNSLEGLPLRSQSPPEPELVTLSVSPADPLSGMENQSPAASFLEQAKQEHEPKLEIPEVRRDAAVRDEGAIPDLAPTFRPFTETIRLLREAEAERLARADDSTADEDSSLVPIAAEQAAEEPERRHRIVDGDTLASLAKRFYGDPALSQAIFDANRGVLEHPEVLPLGTELVIPPAPQAAVSSSAVLGVPVNSDGPLESVTGVEENGLVPIGG